MTSRRGFLGFLGKAAVGIGGLALAGCVPPAEAKEVGFKMDHKATIINPKWMNYENVTASIGEYGGWQDEEFNRICREMGERARAAKEQIWWSSLHKQT